MRDSRAFARSNPHLTIITLDPPRTSVEFHCIPGVRYLDLHTAEFGLGGGSLLCPQASNVEMGGLHITLPMRSDAQERILAFLSEAQPVDVADAKPARVSDLLPKRDGGSMRPDGQEQTLAYANDDAQADGSAAKSAHAPPKPEARAPKRPNNTSFDARFDAVWAGSTNVLGPPVVPWTERSYAGVLPGTN